MISSVLYYRGCNSRVISQEHPNENVGHAFLSMEQVNDVEVP